MGVLGNLLGGKVEVEGRIAAQNRPAEADARVRGFHSVHALRSRRSQRV